MIGLPSRHLCQHNIAGRCGRADEVEHLPRRDRKVFGHVAGISTEALLAVTTAVLSMVAQMASVELILVWLPNGVVKVDALAWAVAMLVAKDRPWRLQFLPRSQARCAATSLNFTQEHYS